MKRFLLFLAVGCGGSGGSAGDDVAPPDGDVTVHQGTLTATWATKNVDGSPASCFSGYPKMKVTGLYWATEFDQPETGGTPISALFDCAAGTGTMQLPIDGPADDGVTYNGKWDITFEQTTSTGDNVIATDLQSQLGRPTTVDLRGGSGSIATTFYQDGGYVWFDWLLYGPTGGDYIATCAGADVDKIDFALTLHDTTETTHITFPCDRPDGLTSGANDVEIEGPHSVGGGIAPIKAGEWDYVATAYMGSTVVGTSAAGEDTIIDPKNHITIFAELADITLTNR